MSELNRLRKIALENGIDPKVFERSWVQSRVFMLSVIKIIHKLYELRPDKKKTVLDIGPHLLGGSCLLKELHSPDSYTRLKLDVSVLDKFDRFKEICHKIDPEIPFITGDIKDLTSTFDIIIASHVIEHVSNPIEFAETIKSKAKDFVIFACPWREFPLTTGGHINSIDKSIVLELGAIGLDIYTDLSWGVEREAAIFWCHGTAK